MSDDLEPFDSDIAALVVEGKKEVFPDDDAKERINRRLQLAIADASAPSPATASSATATATATAPRFSSRARTTLYVFAIAASLALGAGLHAILRPSKIAGVKRHAPSEIAQSTSPVPPSVRQLGGFASAADPTGRALLDEASARMMRGDPKGAVEKLEEHARAHPTGPLTELREAMMVQALVRAKRGDEARVRAEHFFATYPTSLLGPAVTDAIAPLADRRDE